MKIIKNTVITLLVIALVWVFNFLILGNFHKVDNNLYRSAQLFSFNMPYYIEKHGIKSIINLRGSSHKDWYTEEKKIAEKYNITHFDYGFGDREIQSIKKMNKLIELIKNAPKPLLIHCKAGADRTSLASALYRLEIKKDINAHKELSIKYGHFPWLGSKTKAMDESYKNFFIFNNKTQG